MSDRTSASTSSRSTPGSVVVVTVLVVLETDVVETVTVLSVVVVAVFVVVVPVIVVVDKLVVIDVVEDVGHRLHKIGQNSTAISKTMGFAHSVVFSNIEHTSKLSSFPLQSLVVVLIVIELIVLVVDETVLVIEV